MSVSHNERGNSEYVSLPSSVRAYGSKVAIISGVEYVITPELHRMMRFFAESEAISPTNTHVIDCVTPEVWEFILEILEEVSYAPLQPPPKISSSNARDYLQEQLVERLDCTPLRLLNQLYRGCHFLKIVELKSCLACYLACKVHFRYSGAEFRALKTQLNVNAELSSEKIEEYK
jgi:virulence-associated protein VagC